MNEAHQHPHQQQLQSPLPPPPPQKMKDPMDISVRTENLEFGSENLSSHQNCFLNCALQLIWTMDTERRVLQELVQARDLEGPPLLRPLV